MKKLYFSILFVIVSCTFFAQQVVNTAFADQMNQTFANLDKNKIQSGILLDYGMEFINVSAFNGNLTDSTFVNSDNLFEIYNTLLMGRINNNANSGYVDPETFLANWQNNRSADYIALSGLFFNYQKFRRYAYEEGKISYSNGQVSDRYINGVWQNPYENGNVFAVTAPIDTYSGKSFQIKLPSATFYSNFPSGIQTVAIDFDDGLGYRTVAFDQLVSVNYASTGNKVWKYRLTLTNAAQLFAHSKIKILEGATVNPFAHQNMVMSAASSAPPSLWGNPVPNMNHLYTFGMVSEGNYNSFPAKAQIFIDDAFGDQKITNPLIVVEGFDMSTLFDPEKKFSTKDYVDFSLSIFDSNSTDLRSLLFGNGAGFGDQQHDIVYVNWDNGIDYLQRNALVVQDLIKLIKNNLDSSNTTGMVVMGQSMGGVVSRLAIKNLEEQNFQHGIRLFISDDSPQQGASIPLSVQYLFRNLKNYTVRTPFLQSAVNSVPVIQKASTLLDQPAVKQMLINWVDGGYSINNTEHETFYTMLRSKGYPTQNNIRNIAISNGSECGSLQNFGAGTTIISYNGDKKLSFLQDLLSLFLLPQFAYTAGVLIDPTFFAVGNLVNIPGNSKFSANLEDRALYPSGGNKIHDLNVSYTKKIFWLFPVTVNIIDKKLYQPANINKHYDNYGGGFISVGENTGNLSVSNLYVRDRFTLVPTASALDIGGGFTNLSDANYKSSYIGANPPSAPLQSPFHNFTTAFTAFPDPGNNNQKHITFNARNGNWLAAELGLPTQPEYATSCSYLCNTTGISGASSFCGTSTYTAPAGAANYIWTVDNADGNVLISGNGTSSVTLTAINGFSGGFTLNVFLAGECGVSLSKEIWVGTPQFQDLEFLYGAHPILCIAPQDQMQMSIPSDYVQAKFLGMSAAEIGSSASWEWQRTNSNITLNGTKDKITVCPMNVGFSSFKVRAKNACGWSEWYEVSPFEISYVNPPMYYTVSPNPSTEHARISLKNPNKKPKSSHATAKVYDALGNLKTTINVANYSAGFSIGNLPQGTYYLRIQVDGKMENITLIKQ